MTKHRSDIPPAIIKMVDRCLEKSPGKRFQSMRDIRSVLKEARSASDAGVSMDSFARRFYREATSPSRLWRIPAAAIVLALAFTGWYFVRGPSAAAPYSVERMSIRKLSQTNNVAVATISPDGRSIAYVSLEENGSRALWLRRVSDANAIQLVPAQQAYIWDSPAFSNSGEYVYYILAERGATHGTLYRVPSLGGQSRKIVERVNHLGNLSADDSTILFVRYGEPDPNRSVNTTDARIISANATDGSNEKEYRRTEGETILRDPRFSADGKSIFYTKRELEKEIEYWSIVMHDTASGSDQTIIRRRERIGELAVLHSANGLLMNAVDTSSYRRQLFHVSVPDGELTRITNDVSSYMNVSVDRDGRSIVGGQRNEEGRVWIGSVDDPGSMTPMSREALGHQVADWTPDGRVVYDVFQNNRLSIWIADPDGKNSLQLTPQDSDNSEPRVSGDGRFIVFTSRRAGYNQIWRMNIDGSSPSLLADVPGIAQVPRFAADGKTVVFRWFNEGSPPLGKVSIEGGRVEGIDGLPPAIMYYWAMTPDGRSTAHSMREGSTGQTKAVVRSVDGREHVLDISPTRVFKWTPDGSRLVYQERLKGENPAVKIFEIDPLRPVPKLLISTEPDEIYDFSFSRDGKRFAVVRVRTMSDAVMLTAVPPSDGDR